MINVNRNSAVGYRRRGGVSISFTITFTATQFDFKWRAPSGTFVTFDNGNGTITTTEGQDAAEITHTTDYVGADSYDFKITSGFKNITTIDINGQAFVSGGVAEWASMSNLTQIRAQNCTNITGDVSKLDGLAITFCRLDSTGVSGDASVLGTWTTATQVRLNDTSVTFDTETPWTMTGTLLLGNNAWTSTMVDNSLAAFADGPVTGSTINVAGSNAARTAASDADKATILANGNALTVNE